MLTVRMWIFLVLFLIEISIIERSESVGSAHVEAETDNIQSLKSGEILPINSNDGSTPPHGPTRGDLKRFQIDTVRLKSDGTLGFASACQRLLSKIGPVQRIFDQGVYSVSVLGSAWEATTKRLRRSLKPNQRDPSSKRRVVSEMLRETLTLSELSYKNKDELEKKESPGVLKLLSRQAEGFPLFVTGDTLFDAHAYIWLFRDTRTVSVSFRGTNSVTDIKHDLDTRLIELDDLHAGIKVHAGFISKLKSIEEKITSVLDERKDSFDRIIVTGHSLGGALATLAAPIFGEKYPLKYIECLSFGSPRVGNQLFADWFGELVDLNIRWTNEGDPVTSLPFHRHFVHVGEAWSISRSGRVSRVADIPAGKRLRRAIGDLDLLAFFVPHVLVSYVSRLNLLGEKLDFYKLLSCSIICF